MKLFKKDIIENMSRAVKMSRAGNRLPTLSKYYQEYDATFKEKINEYIQNDVNGSCLLRLLNICDGVDENELYSYVPLIEEVLNYYVVESDDEKKVISHSFVFKKDGEPEIRMNVTLEDILFLTGLPITGKPVLYSSDTSRDHSAFEKEFSITSYKEARLTKLQNYAKNKDNPDSKRIAVVLLLIISCVIVPSHDGHTCNAGYVQFVKNLDDVNSYAWGAALLAFLYSSMISFKSGKRRTVNGSTPILMAFFLYRIPKLRVNLKIEVARVTQPTLLLTPVLKALGRIGHTTRSVDNPVRTIFSNLVDDEENICWRPYDSTMLLPRLHLQLMYRTRLVPLFCNNNVVNHLPHVVAKQFLEFEGVDTSGMGSSLTYFNVLNNSGNNPQDFPDYYKEELKLWNDNMCASSSQVGVGVSPSQMQPHSTPNNSPVRSSSQNQNEDENTNQNDGVATNSSTPIRDNLRDEVPIFSPTSSTINATHFESSLEDLANNEDGYCTPDNRQSLDKEVDGKDGEDDDEDESDDGDQENVVAADGTMTTRRKRTNRGIPKERYSDTWKGPKNKKKR